MLRKTYDWVMSLAERPQAPAALGLLAFAEGLFFPIPPDVLLMPVVLGRRDRALRYAALTLVCSILGGSCGYAVGHFLQPVGRWILSLTGGDFGQFEAWYSHWGALLIAVVTEPVALGLIESPGTLGADIVVGEGQSLGVGLQFGGPYLGLFGCREKFSGTYSIKSEVAVNRMRSLITGMPLVNHKYFSASS